MPKLILIDAYSQIFRCFYAIRALTNSKGMPTNAIFAFARLLLQLNERYPSDAGVMAFDCGRPAFRLELAPEYKSNRPPMPEELRLQIPTLRDLADAFGWPLTEMENYEADDLIGAFAKACEKEYEIEIVSGDKDLSQLINERISMLIPAKSGTFEKRGEAEVQNKFQVRPDQMIEYLALLGDSSDNIPGVAGVGPKTAALLLRQVDCLSRFRQNPELCVNEKLREKLLSNWDFIQKNIKLIALKTVLPASDKTLSEQIHRREPDWPRIRQIFEETQLKSLLKELPEAMPKKSGDADLFDFFK